jgi:hypothetical protein
MKPAAILLLLFAGACNSRESVVTSPGVGTPSGVTSAPVSLSPPASATEVAPGVFILPLNTPLVGATPIEEIPEILFVETMYDDKGEETATSVPSSPWSSLSAESKVRLAGMKEGERRRIWTCLDEGRDKCRVEDVMIADRAKAVGTPGAT